MDYEPPLDGGSLALALASPRLIVRYDGIHVDVVTFHDRDDGGAYGVQRRILVALNDLGWGAGEATDAGELLIDGTRYPALTAPAQRSRPRIRARLLRLRRATGYLLRVAVSRRRYATYAVASDDKLRRLALRVWYAPSEVLDVARDHLHEVGPVRKVALAARVGDDRTVVVVGPANRICDIRLEWLSMST